MMSGWKALHIFQATLIPRQQICTIFCKSQAMKLWPANVSKGLYSPKTYLYFIWTPKEPMSAYWCWWRLKLRRQNDCRADVGGRSRCEVEQGWRATEGKGKDIRRLEGKWQRRSLGNERDKLWQMLQQPSLFREGFPPDFRSWLLGFVLIQAQEKDWSPTLLIRGQGLACSVCSSSSKDVGQVRGHGSVKAR